MEFLNWKSILLEWANRLNYLGRAHASLNMVEIEPFYRQYRTNVTSKDIASKKLDSFMSSYFPQFNPSWDEEGKMSCDDYVYGYSLLMFFACVKYPDAKIQKICKDMQPESQLVVKAFLLNLLDSNSFSRETIRSVIEASAPAKVSDYVLALSPTKFIETNVCPATPKSKMLNEWNSENRQLRAQVETERFERGFLEVQLKRKEEEVNELQQERRKFLADIQQLKSQLTEKDTENIPVNHNNSQSETLKRRLRKEISDKEVEINNLQSRVDELTTSKLHFAEKLSHVESQYKTSVDFSAELADRLHELTETCDKQQEHIKGLEINIRDYQKYFNESGSKGNSLESSSDNLEDSFREAMKSMPESMFNPESLGQVVDIQLREQIALYHSLQEKCNGIEIENHQLHEQIDEHIQRTADLELKCRQLVDENATKVQLIEEKCEELAVLSKESELNVVKIQSLRLEFDSLTLKINDNHRTIENLNDAKSSLQHQLNASENEVAQLNTQLETANARLMAAESMRLELASQHQEVLCQKDAMLTEVETEIRRLSGEVKDLKTSLSSAEEKYLKLQTENAELVSAMAKAESDLALQHQEVLNQKDAMLTEAETERCRLSGEVKDLKTSLSSAEEKYLKLQTENAELVSAMAKAESDLALQHQEVLSQKDAMLAEAETERCRLSGEVKDLKTSLSSAEEIYLKLQTQNAELLSAMGKAESDLELQHQEVLSQKDAMLAEAETERCRLSGEVKDLKTSLSSAEEIYLKLQTENAELVSAMAKAESDLALQHQEVLSQKDAMLAESETERCRLSDEVKDLKSSLSSAEEIHLKLQAQNSELLSAMDKAESDLELQHQEVLCQKDAMLAEAEKEIRRLSGEVEGLKSKLSSAEEIYLKLQTENAELVSAIGREKEELRETVSELADCRKDRDLLLQTVANLTDRTANLTTERQQVDSTLADLAASNERMLSERDSLQEELTTLEKARLQFEDRLKALECSRNNLEAQLNQSEDEKEKLFLNLQEKIDEAEVTESALKDWSQRYANEVAKYESAVKRNNLVCESYELQVTSLTNGMSELIISKETLSQANDDLRTELFEIRMQLETMRSEAEQHCNENKQFIESIEGLTQSKNANEAEVQQLQQKLQESNNVYVQLVERCAVLEGENQSLKKSVEDLEIKRVALICQLEVAEREVIDSRQHVNQKGLEVIELSRVIDELKSESAASLVDKTKIEAELQLNVNLVNHLSEELEENKTNLAEKSQLVDTLRDQMEKLKASDISTMTKNSELSEDYEALAKRLDSAESSRDSLSRECTSLTEELKRVEGRIYELEIERSLQANAKDSEIKSLELQVASLKEEMAAMSEVADRKQSELSEKLQTHQEEVETISSKADAKIAELTLSIEELTAQNESLSIAKAELSSQLSHNKIEFESHQRSTDYKAEIEALVKSKGTLSLQVNDLTSETKKLAEDLEKARRENVSLTDENIDLATEIEKVRTEYSASDASNRGQINSLKSELNRLETANLANHQRIDELQKSNEAKSNDMSSKDKCAKLEADLKIALTDLEAKMQECRQIQDDQTQLVHDNKILSAKLTQHRKLTAEKEEAWQIERTALMEQREKSCTEIRFELEGKLNKMKERMKHIYTEETSKSKEKHEKQERELINYKNQCQLLSGKIDRYVSHVQTISEQMYQLNEQNLDLKKDNEFLKSKLRLAESNPRESRLFPPPNFGSNLRIEMEDEPEMFNNTYLCELKSGVPRTSPQGRESIRQSELQQRNSIAARHLRSTYAAQYGDQNLKEEDISMPYFNDSMFSNQLDVRRGTLYKRPGPPTPSKNGGRLSFGGSIVNASDLFPKDILREQNTNAKTKTTPGKLMSMFSSSKHKENDVRKAITRPIYVTFTSTPRRKSNWTRERKSILAIKLNSSELTDCDDDDAASTVSNESLLSKTSGARRSITRRFSIISKTKQVSASLMHKKRSEYRKKNHSKRQEGFEHCREIFLKMDDHEDDNFQMDLLHDIGYLKRDQLFASDLRQSEKFEILTKRTISEHPYSNEPTAIEAVEANESSLTSSACHSKTMGNIIMYGKIPRITVNETPQRELIRLNQRSGSIWSKLVDLAKETFLVLVLIVVYASYFMWNLLSQPNE